MFVLTCVQPNNTISACGATCPQAITHFQSELLARGCGSTDRAQRGPYKNDQARLVSILLHSTRAMLVLNVPAFENNNNKKYTADDRFHAIWRNPDQEGTNQNARIYLAI